MFFVTWKIAIIAISASEILKFEKALWSWPSHPKSFFSIFSQFAIKTWKSPSWVTQKKHDLMIQLSAAFKIESLASYNSQLSIWWLTTNCVTVKFESESIFIFLSLSSYAEVDELTKRIKREKRRNRDRIEYQTSKSSRFLALYFTFTFIILIARLDRTATSEDVSDTIQFFMRRKP